MAQQGQDKTFNAAVELLLANGFDGVDDRPNGATHDRPNGAIF